MESARRRRAQPPSSLSRGMPAPVDAPTHGGSAPARRSQPMRSRSIADAGQRTPRRWGRGGAATQRRVKKPLIGNPWACRRLQKAPPCRRRHSTPRPPHAPPDACARSAARLPVVHPGGDAAQRPCPAGASTWVGPAVWSCPAARENWRQGGRAADTPDGDAGGDPPRTTRAGMPQVQRANASRCAQAGRHRHAPRAWHDRSRTTATTVKDRNAAARGSPGGAMSGPTGPPRREVRWRRLILLRSSETCTARAA